MGIVLYGGLAIIGSIFGGRGELDHEARSGDYDYAAEQARLASEYHRRDRESRF